MKIFINEDKCIIDVEIEELWSWPILPVSCPLLPPDCHQHLIKTRNNHGTIEENIWINDATFSSVTKRLPFVMLLVVICRLLQV